MYSTLLTAVALFVAPALAGFAISSPELTQCGTSKISWSPSKGPYNLIAVNAADPCGEPLVEIGDFDKTFVDWKNTIPAGTIVQLSVADSDDEEAWSGNITVAASDDSSCLSSVTTSDSTTGTGSSTTGSTTSSFTGGSTDSTDKTDDGSKVVPVGAANAGTNKIFNAAPAARKLNGPVLALSAIAAVAALAL